MKWIQEELELMLSTKKKAIIITHIANGNIRSSAGEITDYWHPEYRAQFELILQHHTDILSMMFTGHTHEDDIRVNNIGVNLKPSLGSSSFYNNGLVVRGVSQNNPGFAMLWCANEIRFIYS